MESSYKCRRWSLTLLIRSTSEINPFLLDDYDFLVTSYLGKHNKCGHLFTEHC